MAAMTQGSCFLNSFFENNTQLKGRYLLHKNIETQILVLAKLAFFT